MGFLATFSFFCLVGPLKKKKKAKKLMSNLGCRRDQRACVTFDLGHVLILAWEEPREQAVSVNEGDYFGGLGRMVRLRDRLQGGERWVIVWVYPSRHVR